MSKEELLKIQTCILKVHMHCDGCKKKVKKTLQKIDGVYTVDVDSEQAKVTVKAHGNVDPQTLIKKLKKCGKPAQVWGAPKDDLQMNSQQVDGGIGGEENSKTQGPKDIEDNSKTQRPKDVGDNSKTQGPKDSGDNSKTQGPKDGGENSEIQESKDGGGHDIMPEGSSGSDSDE